MKRVSCYFFQNKSYHKGHNTRSREASLPLLNETTLSKRLKRMKRTIYLEPVAEEKIDAFQTFTTSIRAGD